MDDDNDSDIDIPMSKIKPLPDLDGNSLTFLHGSEKSL